MQCSNVEILIQWSDLDLQICKKFSLGFVLNEVVTQCSHPQSELGVNDQLFNVILPL